MIAKNSSKFEGLDLSLQYDTMIDWHKGKGRKIKDYDATFRNWCRKAIQFDGAKPPLAKKQRSIQDLTPAEKEHYGY